MNKYVMLSLAAVFISGCSSDNPRDIVRRAGYLTTVPPSSSFGPGNVVWKKTNQYNDKEDVSLGYICSPEYVKLPGHPEKGGGEVRDFGNKKDFSFGADNLKTLGLSLSAQYVSNLTIKFSNIEYLEYGLDKLEIIENGLGPQCTKILKKQRKKRNAYIISTAFKADLDHKVTYKALVNSSIKAKIVKEIQAEFGISADKNEGRVGRGLYYGVHPMPLY
jgi:hypothetical protein